MIKYIGTMNRLLLVTLICTAATPLQATLFGHSSKKVNNLRSSLEKIKADYDAAVARANSLQSNLDEALLKCTAHQAEIESLRNQLKAYVNEAARLKALADEKELEKANLIRQVEEVRETKESEHTSLLAEFKKQVDRLTQATTKLEELENTINEMLELPETIFGVK